MDLLSEAQPTIQECNQTIPTNSHYIQYIISTSTKTRHRYSRHCYNSLASKWTKVQRYGFSQLKKTDQTQREMCGLLCNECVHFKCAALKNVTVKKRNRPFLANFCKLQQAPATHTAPRPFYTAIPTKIPSSNQPDEDTVPLREGNAFSARKSVWQQIGNPSC